MPQRELRNIVSDIVGRNLTPQLRANGSWLENRAEEMRAQMPKAERLLWEQVRDNQRGYDCQSQIVITERYIADFYVPSVKLIVELDGKSHEGREDYDWRRTHLMIAAGYEVLRFANVEVYDDIEDVLSRIDAGVYALMTDGDAIRLESLRRYCPKAASRK